MTKRVGLGMMRGGEDLLSENWEHSVFAGVLETVCKVHRKITSRGKSLSFPPRDPF